MLRVELPMRELGMQLGPLVRLGFRQGRDRGPRVRELLHLGLPRCACQASMAVGAWFLLGQGAGRVSFNKVGLGVGCTTHRHICQARLARPCRNGVPHCALLAAPDEKLEQLWCSWNLSVSQGLLAS